MNRHNSRAPAIALAALLITLSACAQVPTQQGLSDLQSPIRQAWSADPVWPQSAPERDTLAATSKVVLEKPLTADSAVRLTLLNSPRLQALYQNLDVSYAQVVQAGLISNPVLEGKIKVPLESGAVGLELGIAQNIIDILYIPIRTRVAQAEFDALRPRTAAGVTAILAKVELQTLALQAQANAVAIRAKALDVADGLETFANELDRVGNITPAHKARLLAQATQIRDHAHEAIARHAADTHTLLGLIGIAEPYLTTTIAPLPGLPDVPFDDRSLQPSALQNSLALKAARADTLAGAALLKAHRDTRLLPEGELGLEAERDSSGDWSLGPIFALPIPLFDQGQAKVAGSYARVRQSDALAQNVEIMLRAQIRALKTQLARADQHHRAITQNLLPARDRAMDESLLEYNAMLIGADTLLMARLAQIDAQEAQALASGRLAVTRRKAQLLALGIPIDSPAGDATADASNLTIGNENISNNFTESH
jgi:outer membrane protein, heavy metal efflux system